MAKFIERLFHVRPNVMTHVAVARALVKFCEDHKYDDNPQWLEDIRLCLQALEEGDFAAASKAFQRVPLGKDGFGDWSPHVTFEKENREYLETVFVTLLCRWQALMDHGPYGYSSNF